MEEHFEVDIYGDFFYILKQNKILYPVLDLLSKNLITFKWDKVLSDHKVFGEIKAWQEVCPNVLVDIFVKDHNQKIVSHYYSFSRYDVQAWIEWPSEDEKIAHVDLEGAIKIKELPDWSHKELHSKYSKEENINVEGDLPMFEAEMHIKRHEN